MKRKNKILIIATAAGLLLVTMVTIFAISCNPKTTETFASIEESISSEETTSAEESSEAESIEEESSVVPSSIASSSKAVSTSSKAVAPASSKAPEASSAVSQTPPPVDNDWDFKEGVTYETILKPYAVGLGYSCAISSSGKGRYIMEFTKGNNMVYVSAYTSSRGAELELKTPYIVIWGTVERVRLLIGVTSAPGEMKWGLNDTSFIKNKLSEWSAK